VNKAHWWPAYIGIGSNLESPAEQVAQAINALREMPDCLVIQESGLYRSAPMGPQEQPDFINAVVSLLTQLDAGELLQVLHGIEEIQGRARNAEQWGPRTLDLDLLAYASQISNDEELTLPHPRIAERNFVLLPWNELTPQFRVPGLASVADLAAKVSRSEPRIERMD
jgi:2-amino-4-hydroxy-6-hydroxymethyldihydropteridine diphosphokinase